MKFSIPSRLIWKLYFFIWTWICIGGLLSLIFPEASPFVFYGIVKTILPDKHFLYVFALIKAGVNIFSLWPLGRFAFHRPARWVLFWQIIFFMRIVFEIIGNKYEQLFIHSFFANSFSSGISVLFAVLAFLIPSYVGHYQWAFIKKAPLKSRELSSKNSFSTT